MTTLEIHKENEATVGEAIGCLNVVLAYEDFSTGLRARQAFEGMARQLKLEADFNVDLWKFDLLCEPILLERAANDAAKANMVFISAHSQGHLPGAANIWLKQWLECRGGEPCALVVLFDTLAGDTVAANHTSESLRAMASAAGVDVFLHAGETSQAEPQSVRNEIYRHPESSAALPNDFPRRTERHSYRHWGINE